MEKFIYELKNPIMYSGGTGEEIEGGFIEISEPTGKVSHLAAILKSEIGAATKKSIEGIDLSTVESSADADSASATTEEVGDSSFSMLLMGGANMQRVMVTFKEMLIKTSLLASEKSFTSPMFDRMSYADVEGCLKAYIGNFLKA